MGYCWPYLVAALFLCVASQIARAVDAPTTEPTDIPPGHSSHGDAFDEGPRTAAYLMGNTGKVHFPVSTLLSKLFGGKKA
jgi:hypothetical protein